jgi:carboxypeptidase Taq
LDNKLKTLQYKLSEVQNINMASAVLGWDQQVLMPPGGAEARADQLATLDKVGHELFTTDEIGQLLEDLAGQDYAYDSAEASLIRVAQRDYEKSRKLSSQLVEELSRTCSLGQQVWTKARAEQDFSQFQEILSKIIDLTRQKAEAYGYDDDIYDALLDDYEPSVKTAEVRRVFEELKAGLVPLVQAIAERSDAVDGTVLQQDFDETAQWDFGMEVLAAIGFDLQRGRQDKSVHPFTTSFSVNDVRLTTRVFKDLFSSGLFGTLHEGGHGLYEQNIEPSLDGSLLAGGTSLGVHESQSRLWENVLGRSKPFWQFYYPRLQQFFPAQLNSVSLETFYGAVNKVEPSFIRVEADEVTYNLHIFIRFELEQALMKQEIKIADLPEAWNAKVKEYLGLTPPNDALGVLQDVHWSAGLFGYFPTYALGNVLSLQFYEQTLRDLPDLPEQFSRGEFGALLAWFREKIHRHGRKFTANELVEEVTGATSIQAQPYLTYIQNKFSNIYGL